MSEGLTRREALAALLAAPLLLARCGGRAAPPLPPGEVVGASDGFGHLLQARPGPPPEVGAWRDTEVLIAGGGVAGLSAAWRLVRAGLSDFVLLELEQTPGGTACSGQCAISRFPWGAHYLPLPRRENRALIRLLDELGVLEGQDEEGEPVAGEQYLCREPEERIFYRGQWHEGLYLHEGADAEDQRQFQVFQNELDRWAAWRDGRGRRAFDLPVAAASDDPEVRALDRTTMAEFLDRRALTSPRLRWYVEYACRDDYGLPLAHTSAWAGLFYFVSRLKRPGAAAQPLLVWPEGNGRLVEHLRSQVAAQVHLGWAVTNIVPPAEGSAAPDARVAVWALNRRGERQGFRARRVIFAAPQYLTPFVLEPYRLQPPAHVREFEYGSWAVANLQLRERPPEPGFPLCWDNVLYESPSLGYVVATHQTGSDYGPTVFTHYHAFCEPDAKAARTRLQETSRDVWAETVLRDLEAAHPDIRGLVTRLDVMRWGHAMIRPKPGFIWGAAREKARQPCRGVHFAHSDLSGVALFEEAFYHGLRAAEEVLPALGRPLPERWV